MPSFIRPTYKIVMEEFSSWRPCLGCFHSSRRSSPTADIKDRNLRKRLQKFCRISTLKSSNAPIGSAGCGPAQTLDRRALHRMAQSLPTARQGLGEPQQKGARVLAPRINPPHAQKTLQSGLNSPDRLLDRLIAAEQRRSEEDIEMRRRMYDDPGDADAS